jgi:hypothetical protein
VRLRGDQVSVSCANASEYAPDEEEATAPTQVATDVTQDAHTVPRDTEPKDAAHQPPPLDADGTAPTPAAAASLAHSEMAVAHRLNLRMRESDDPTADRMLLDDLKRVLLEHDGKDEVTLEIAARGQVYMLEWPMVKVDVSEDLMDQLRRLLGESGRVTVESP